MGKLVRIIIGLLFWPLGAWWLTGIAQARNPQDWTAPKRLLVSAVALIAGFVLIGAITPSSQKDATSEPTSVVASADKAIPEAATTDTPNPTAVPDPSPTPEPAVAMVEPTATTVLPTPPPAPSANGQVAYECDPPTVVNTLSITLCVDPDDLYETRVISIRGPSGTQISFQVEHTTDYANAEKDNLQFSKGPVTFTFSARDDTGLTTGSNAGKTFTITDKGDGIYAVEGPSQ